MFYWLRHCIINLIILLVFFNKNLKNVYICIIFFCIFILIITRTLRNISKHFFWIKVHWHILHIVNVKSFLNFQILIKRAFVGKLHHMALKIKVWGRERIIVSLSVTNLANFVFHLSVLFLSTCTFPTRRKTQLSRENWNFFFSQITNTSTMKAFFSQTYTI